MSRGNASGRPVPAVAHDGDRPVRHGGCQFFPAIRVVAPEQRVGQHHEDQRGPDRQVHGREYERQQQDENPRVAVRGSVAAKNAPASAFPKALATSTVAPVVAIAETPADARFSVLPRRTSAVPIGRPPPGRPPLGRAPLRAFDGGYPPAAAAGGMACGRDLAAWPLRLICATASPGNTSVRAWGRGWQA